MMVKDLRPMPTGAPGYVVYYEEPPRRGARPMLWCARLGMGLGWLLSRLVRRVDESYPTLQACMDDLSWMKNGPPKGMRPKPTKAPPRPTVGYIVPGDVLWVHPEPKSGGKVER